MAGTTNEPIRKVGFFHFCNEDTYAHPVEALAAAMTRKDVADSLIVLPEAFNLGKHYWTRERCSPDPDILGRLQSLTERLPNVSLVAGVIVPEGHDPPYSSSYLISKSREPLLLSHKRQNDGRGVGGMPDFRPHYTPCSEACDVNVGTHHRHLVIASLICMDAIPDDTETQESGHRRLRAAFAQAPAGTPRVLCISAHMKRSFDPQVIAEIWPDTSVVLANSYHAAPGSFVVKVGGIIGKNPIKCRVDPMPEDWKAVGRTNEIKLASLE